MPLRAEKFSVDFVLQQQNIFQNGRNSHGNPADTRSTGSVSNRMMTRHGEGRRSLIIMAGAMTQVVAAFT